MKDEFLQVLENLGEDAERLINLRKEQIQALKLLYDDLKQWLSKYEEEKLVEIKEKEVFDFTSGYTELDIIFTKIHHVTVRPQISYPQNEFYVHLNYYKEYSGISDLKSSPTNTTRLNYSSGKWIIATNFDFGQPQELFTVEAFKKDIEEKMLSK
ncbi:hypothetical protein [Paenibacillus sp. S02]|uniref:hypothetical protein n=1 Tax=Paenibacillus sp. S02 TaxID=2823904 RepID=UPI001C649D2C|nr:hypothetical protein [Paenibacillus sp. S02]QYK68274.1 hypothetical protein KAI36_03425 [Paenibacillus sp. S02]